MGVAYRHTLEGIQPGPDYVGAWRRPAITDSKRRVRSVLEQREHQSTAAALKGTRWYAKRLLDVQAFPDWLFASRTLIQASRQRIEETRHRITRTRNILVFARTGREAVN